MPNVKSNIEQVSLLNLLQKGQTNIVTTSAGEEILKTTLYYDGDVLTSLHKHARLTEEVAHSHEESLVKANKRLKRHLMIFKARLIFPIIFISSSVLALVMERGEEITDILFSGLFSLDHVALFTGVVCCLQSAFIYYVKRCLLH